MVLFGAVRIKGEDSASCTMKFGTTDTNLTFPNFLLTEAGVIKHFLCHFKKDGDIELVALPNIHVTHLERENKSVSRRQVQELLSWIELRSQAYRYPLGIASSF